MAVERWTDDKLRVYQPPLDRSFIDRSTLSPKMTNHFWLSIFLPLLVLSPANCQQSTGQESTTQQTTRQQPAAQQPTEKWGYVDVRPQAHMFWWLYFAQVASSSTPLVVWLQGGPGASSTGFGNFEEIGPLDVEQQPRNTTWLRYAHLLFIDNPVGTGFSYVDDSRALATNNSMIANDLVTLMVEFYKQVPQLQSAPLYIFSESYGGKMTATFGIHLHQAIEAGRINCNFQGVALGDSWISPVDSTASWSEYLRTMSLVDGKEQATIDSLVDQIKIALANGQNARATELWSETESLVERETGGVNWYNILQPADADGLKKRSDRLKRQLEGRMNNSLSKAYYRTMRLFASDPLDQLMNGPVKQKLSVIPANVSWGGQSADVFSALQGDFMLPVVDDVDFLLNRTGLSVTVYTGQLDLIVDTLGTLKWIRSLKWPGLNSFLAAPRLPMQDQFSEPVGYYKSYKNLSLFWILKAGHMVPADAGTTAIKMLKKVVYRNRRRVV